MEKVIKDNPKNIDVLYEAKRMGFSDSYIGRCWGISYVDVYNFF